MQVTDSEIKSVEGKPYNLENAKKLIYGGRVNSHGIITIAYTKEEYEKIAPKCKPFWKCEG